MNARTVLASLSGAVCIAGLAPSLAQAASCSRPGVTVSANHSTVRVGERVDYAYKLCFTSTPARYETQLLQVAKDGTTVSATRAQGSTISSGPVTGGGVAVPVADGDYVIRVSYFAAGRARATAVGEARFRATPEHTTSPTTPDTPAPADAQPAPQGGPQARVALTQHVTSSTVRRGGRVSFRLTARNVGRVAARRVRVCGRLPADTQYASASRSVTFSGDRACVGLGTLAAGMDETVRITLRVDRAATTRRLTSEGTVTALNAPAAHARASSRVVVSRAPRVRAPITG